MNITIWLTHKCNMDCIYCYEKDKDRTELDLEMAKKVYMYISKVLVLNKIQTCVVHFHGGEPLLKNSLITFFITQFSKIKNVKFFYSITTNGTIINESVLANLKQMYDINVSLDGDDEIQNENRPMKDGSISSTILKSNISKIIKNDINFNVRMTITPTNIKKINSNIDFLYNLNVKSIICAIDYWNYRWELKDIINYRNEINKIKEKYGIDKKVHISGIDDSCKFAKGKCLGGINSIVIDCDGSIYPCTVLCGNYTFKIGCILDDGILDDWLGKLNTLNTFSKNKCNTCLENNMCQARRCVLLGYANENILPNLCLIQKTSG